MGWFYFRGSTDGDLCDILALWSGALISRGDILKKSSSDALMWLRFERD